MWWLHEITFELKRKHQSWILLFYGVVFFSFLFVVNATGTVTRFSSWIYKTQSTINSYLTFFFFCSFLFFMYSCNLCLWMVQPSIRDARKTFWCFFFTLNLNVWWATKNYNSFVTIVHSWAMWWFRSFCPTFLVVPSNKFALKTILDHNHLMLDQVVAMKRQR